MRTAMGRRGGELGGEAEEGKGTECLRSESSGSSSSTVRLNILGVDDIRKLALQFAVLRFVSRACPVRDPSLIFSAVSDSQTGHVNSPPCSAPHSHRPSFSTPPSCRRRHPPPSLPVPVAVPLPITFPMYSLTPYAQKQPSTFFIPSSTSHVLSATPLSTLLSLIRRAFIPRRTTRRPALGIPSFPLYVVIQLIVTNTPLRQSAPSSLLHLATNLSVPTRHQFLVTCLPSYPSKRVMMNIVPYRTGS